MSDSRYHIHLACVPDDVSIQTAHDDLLVFFKDKAFVTRDLLVVDQRSASYSRHCVNECDAVIFIIGHDYGRVNQSGVSQLHLTYTNAKTKNKPMLIFVSQEKKGMRNRHLADFVNSIKNQHPHIIRFNAYGEINHIIALAFENLDLSKPQWHHQSNLASMQAETKSAVELLENDLLDSILPTHKVDVDVRTATNPMLLDDELSLDCTAHVFEGGTLIEVEYVFTLTWRRVLLALLELKTSFSEQSFVRCLNDLIDKTQVDEMILTQHPKAHAVSRHQIKKMELTRLRIDLQSVGWIVSVGQNMLWTVSDEVRSALRT